MRPKLGFDPLGVPAVPPDVSLPLNMAAPDPAALRPRGAGSGGFVSALALIRPSSPALRVPGLPARPLSVHPAGAWLTACTGTVGGHQPGHATAVHSAPGAAPAPPPASLSPQGAMCPSSPSPRAPPALPLCTPRLGLASPSVKPWRPAGICGSRVAFLRCRRVSELGAHQPPLDGVLWRQGLSRSLLFPVRGPPPRATPVSGLGCVCR